jgi:hypothetical protein
MTTDLLERVPVDRITEQAREVRFWRSVLTLAAAFLFGLGWVTAKAFGLAWFAVVWAGCAVREGWREGRGVKPGQPSQVR